LAGERNPLVQSGENRGEDRFALFAIRGGEEPRKAEISSFNSDEGFYLFKAGRTKK